MHSPSEPPAIDRRLLRASVRLNAVLFSLLGALTGGLGLFLLTRLSSAKPENLLNILIIFLPGYQVSSEGAWMGLLWGAVIGAIAAAMFYLLYARGIEGRVKRLLDTDLPPDALRRVPITLNPLALGVTTGLLAALAILAGTRYLVASHHTPGIHIELLGYWLPGFALSNRGAIYGAVDMFALVFLFFFLLAWLYNRLIAAPDGTTR